MFLYHFHTTQELSLKYIAKKIILQYGIFKYKVHTTFVSQGNAIIAIYTCITYYVIE